MKFNFNFAKFFQKTLFKFINSIFIIDYNLELNFYYKNLILILIFLKNHTNLQYKSLIDISVVDYPVKLYRFELVYNLLSLQYSSRIKIRTKLKDMSVIATTCCIYKGSNWIEREVWDMFGITFEEHPDLRRILNDYGFDGFPLRKDYPLIGYNEVFFDDVKSSIVYEKVSLSQEYRQFYYTNLWDKI